MLTACGAKETPAQTEEKIVGTEAVSIELSDGGIKVEAARLPMIRKRLSMWPMTLSITKRAKTLPMVRAMKPMPTVQRKLLLTPWFILRSPVLILSAER